MEKKLFEISKIENNDNLNALSIALNAKEQVSHIKIDKLTITFYCLDIDVLMNTILDIDKNVVVKEIINGRKSTYRFNAKKEMKRKNYEVWVKTYEEFYKKPLEYSKQ